MADVILLNPAYPQLAAVAAAYGLREAGEQITVVEQGVTLRATLYISSGTVDGYTLEALGRAFPAVTFTVEGESDRTAKALRLDVEPQVGDPPFDDRVYVDTTLDEPLVQRLLASPDARRAVAWLLASQVRAVKLGPHGLEVELPREALEPNSFRTFASVLSTLVRALPELSVRAPTGRYRGALWLLLAAMVYAALGLALMVYAVTNYQALSYTPYLLTIPILVGLGAIFTVTSYFVTRGQPRSSQFFFPTVFTFVFGSFFHAFGDLVWINAVFDSSPAVEREFRVLETTADDDTTEYRLAPPKGAWEKRTVHFRRTITVVDDKIRFATHEGFLGWEWTTTNP